MSVTKQTYTAAATWTPAQHADIFRQAFIDAGLMTDWHDSFLSGSIENRVLRVIYDGTKTYGTTFYWFQFNTSSVSMNLATGWNTSTKVPTGTLYLDYGTAATNSVSGLSFASSRSTTTTNELIRYTSQDNSNFSVFITRQGTTNNLFMIAHPSYTVAPWIDLNKTLFHHFIDINASPSQSSSYFVFISRNCIRRSFLTGITLNGDTSYRSSYGLALCGYSALGKSTSVGSNVNFNTYLPAHYDRQAIAPHIVLPTGETDANPAYTTDSNPVYTGMPVSPYMTNYVLPGDFAIIPHYATNTMEVLDKFVVTAGVEEWEILARANNATAVTGASIAFAARIV